MSDKIRFIFSSNVRPGLASRQVLSVFVRDDDPTSLIKAFAFVFAFAFAFGLFVEVEARVEVRLVLELKLLLEMFWPGAVLLITNAI